MVPIERALKCRNPPSLLLVGYILGLLFSLVVELAGGRRDVLFAGRETLASQARPLQSYGPGACRDCLGGHSPALAWASEWLPILAPTRPDRQPPSPLGRSSSSSSSAAPRPSASSQGYRNLDGITGGVDVQVHRGRFGPQKVVVERGDLDPALGEPVRNGSDLLMGQHKVSRYHDPVALERLECEPRAKRRPRPELEAVDRDAEVGPREPEAADPTLLLSGRAAQALPELLPIDISLRRRRGKEKGDACEVG